MAEVVFFIAGAGAIAGAVGVIAMPNAFYSVLSLVFHLLCLAALFLLLRAEFVAAAQVVVYAGAVMVLYVFVVAYIGQSAQLMAAGGGGLLPLAVVFAGALAIELLVATLGSGLKLVSAEGAPYEPGFGTTAQIGELLLTRFLLAFEIASYLLLVAAVGAVILARRRGGLPEAEAARFFDVPRPAGTGTMAEAMGAGLTASGRRQAAQGQGPGGW